MTTIAQRVGRYELVRVIGRGGMATVYLAHQSDLDRHVALKELALFNGPEPRLSRRFLSEARLAGSLSHPNIVTVYDYLEQDGVPYIAMEYLAHGSLRPYVGRLSPAHVGGVLHGMLGGLAHAEELGIVHRDIKPENVMVTSQGSVKIADFGIAKATNAAATSADLTTTGTTLGTPRYMAPERALGQEVGPWSDLYSVGVMAFELLVGHVPFQDTEAPMAILMRQINDPVPSVRSVRHDVDPALSDWVDRLLVKDPEARTRSAVTAWGELEEILGDVLGVRWHREASLPELPDGPAAARERATGATTPFAPPTRTTAGMPEDLALAATLAPSTERLQRERRQKAPRRRLPGRARLALVVATLVMAVAGIALGRGGQPHPAHDPSGRGEVPAGADATVAPAVAGQPYADALERSLGALQGRVRTHTNALDAAVTPAARATALRTLADDYDGAVRSLQGLEPGPGDRASNDRLVAALDQMSRSYRDAAAASESGDAGEATQARIDNGQTAIAAALAHLQDAGSTSGGDSGVGDSRSDDPSDDEPDENDNGD